MAAGGTYSWGTLYSDVLAADEEDAEPSGSPRGDLYTVRTSVVLLFQLNLWLQTSLSLSIAKLSAGAELLGLSFGGSVSF